MASSRNTKAFWNQRDYGFWEDPGLAQTRDSPIPWATRYFLRSLLPQLQGKRVLDLGCGPGVLTPYLAKAADHVVGLDFSENAIATARRRCADLPNVSFIVGDLISFAPDQKFDVITGRMILHEIMHEDTPRLLRSLDTMLADGGFLYVHENSYFNVFARFVRRHLVGRYGIPKYGSEHELPFDQARFEMYSDFFRYCERFVEGVELAQKVHDYLVPIRQVYIERLFLAVDRLLTVFHEHTGLLDNWSYAQTIYVSQTVPRAAVFGASAKHERQLVAGSSSVG